MCLHCHENIPDEELERQLNEALIKPNFDEWNNVSVSHFAIAGMKANGELNSKLGIKLLENYIDYKKNNIREGDNSFFGAPSYDRVQRQLDKVREFNNKADEHNLSKEDIRNFLFKPDSNDGKRIIQLIGKMNQYLIDLDRYVE